MVATKPPLAQYGASYAQGAALQELVSVAMSDGSPERVRMAADRVRASAASIEAFFAAFVNRGEDRRKDFIRDAYVDATDIGVSIGRFNADVWTLLNEIMAAGGRGTKRRQPEG